MFKETKPAPISEGIIAVAALFAIIAAGVAFVLYDFSLFASACITFLQAEFFRGKL